MKQQVAILGLGTMGVGMAKHLLKAGHSVTGPGGPAVGADKSTIVSTECVVRPA